MTPFRLVRTFFLFCLILLPSFSNAYSWQLSAIPSQCSNVSISIVGNDGHPPYRLLLIPFGPSPLPDSVEVRGFVDLSFDGNSTFIDFPLNYPARSQFVAVVSDMTGFATGGTSNVMTVASSSNAGCFNATSPPPPRPFSFSVSPNYFTQCLPNMISWNGQNAQGTPDTFFVIVPGGKSFTIPTTNASNVDGPGGKGIFWVPPLPTGTTFALIGNNTHGIGYGSTVIYSTAYSDDRSCLNNTNPSPMNGNLPGAVNATTADKSNSNTAVCGGIQNKRVNDAAIVGGILGGVVAALLFTLVYTHRKRCTGELQIKDDLTDLDQYFYPPMLHRKQSSRDLEPNRYPLDIYPDFTSRTTKKERALRNVNHNHESTLRTHDDDDGSVVTPKRSQHGSTSSRTRLVIQHGDGGPSSSPSSHSLGEQEVIELPPSYTNIRQSLNHLHRFRFCPNQSRSGSIK